MILPVCTVFLAVCVGCADVDTAEYDLPLGWEDSRLVSSFIVELSADSCVESEECARVEPSFGGGRSSLLVDVFGLRFRCEQDTHAFFKIADTVADFLVQPVDMDPESVAKCDCDYDVAMVVDGISVGVVDVNVYRRWDNWSGPNDPVPIGSTVTTVLE